MGSLRSGWVSRVAGWSAVMLRIGTVLARRTRAIFGYALAA
jgi:hypothetical protein